MALGNDIVDLTDSFAREKGRCRRYASRILSAREFEWWEESADPGRFLWACWSVKEAAYKAFRKIAGPLTFLPKKIGMTEYPRVQDRENRGTIGTPWGDARFRLFFRDSYVHALCGGPARIDILERTQWRVEEMKTGGDGRDGGYPVDASREVRRAAAVALAPVLGVREEEIRILRDRGDTGSPVPRLLVGGREHPADLSLSHDGRYVAFAFTAWLRQPGT